METRYNKKFSRPMVVIQPGEYYATGQDEVLSSTLGSCISVCLYDPVARVGAMNHFVLPGKYESRFGEPPSTRYGQDAMQRAVSEIARLGGDPRRIVAKYFGGGRILSSSPEADAKVCRANIEFIRECLVDMAIEVAGCDVGGKHGRKIFFLPLSGKVYIKKAASLFNRPELPGPRRASAPPSENRV